MRITLVALFLIGFLLGNVQARPIAPVDDELIDAFIRYAKSDFDQAFPRFLVLANKGIRDAQTRVGMMYLQGEGVRREHAQGMKWLSLAAAQGSGEAAVELERAIKLFTPRKLEEQTIAWLTRAAERGHGEANVALGEIYFFGLGTERDYKAAMIWFERGAEVFDPNAFYYLGLCFSSGTVAGVDLVAATKWFELALQYSPLDGAPANFLDAFQTTRERLMPAQAATASQEAKDWIWAH
jgi:uncharacterized protein